ncbi:hypothetical protein [Moritella sp.]|uniref:hypothetical protein n=1 Tax=Moritella sp. TaxID=78556 RepID=UPI0025EBD2DE|nr:hypothetical protein [Moritella sp.]MCJ8351378.1 hypothetical protein [Moritella sp.]
MNDYIETLEFLIENPKINTINESTSEIDVRVIKELHDNGLIDAIDCCTKSGLSFLTPQINLNGKEWLSSKKQGVTSSSVVTEDIIDLKPNFMGLGINLNALIRWFRRR